MMGLIADSMRKALDVQSNGEDLDFAFHWGKAGGIATVTGAFGVKSLELCDDISDAFEVADTDLMNFLLKESLDRPDGGQEHYARTREDHISYLEWGAALQEAIKAKDEGDLQRHSLMIGFTTGMMYYFPETEPGAIRDVFEHIVRGYETGSNELLEQAAGYLRFGVRMSDPINTMGKAEARRYFEEKMRTMRWVQNFGLREARYMDETVGRPNSFAMNFQLVQQDGQENKSESEDVTD